jgi:hypothetical protein
MTPDELIERLISFAARIGKVVDALPDTRMRRHIGGQLVRSGTSPAPNYEEGCAAESRADFGQHLSERTARVALVDSVDYQNRDASEASNGRLAR